MLKGDNYRIKAIMYMLKGDNCFIFRLFHIKVEIF